MPVEDRLRRGLEANARAFLPEGERRLVQVHRRHRARTRTLAAAAAAAVAATVAVTATMAGSLPWSEQTGAPEPVRQPTQVASSTAAYTGPRIPDSGWRKVVTREQLVRAGAGSVFLAENLGRADRLLVTLSFIGEVYSQSGRYPGAWAVGDAGTLAYAPDGRLVLTSTAPACRGCVASLKWRIQGNRLELSGFRGTPGDPLARVMLEGNWSKLDV